METTNIRRGTTQKVVNKNNRYAEELLLGISSALKTQRGDPEQKPFKRTLFNTLSPAPMGHPLQSGSSLLPPHPGFAHLLPQGAKAKKVQTPQKPQRTRKIPYGFTLIELLVVILIIGILAAVALPQYQLSVAKTRYTQLITLASTLRKGQDLYKLAHGEYADEIQSLDIDLPPGSTFSTSTIYYTWGYCGIGKTGWAACCNTQYGVCYNDLSQLKECKVKPGENEEFGKKICVSMGGKQVGKDGNGYFVYDL